MKKDDFYDDYNSSFDKTYDKNKLYTNIIKYNYNKNDLYDWVPDEGSINRVRKIIESFVMYDTIRQSAMIIPIVTPTVLERDISQSLEPIEESLSRFNKTIPRQGIHTNWETDNSKGTGTIWSLRMTPVKQISVELTMEDPKMPAPEIRMNGTRKTKKSDGSLISLNIERLYVVDGRGMEITLHSII